GHDCLPASGGPIGRGPVAVGEIAVFAGTAGDLDHAVQRDVFDDLELSHCESRFLSLAIIPWGEEDPTHLDRHPTGNDGLTCPCKRLVPGRIAYPAFTKTTNGRTGIRQAVEKSLALAAPQAIRSRHLVL